MSIKQPLPEVIDPEIVLLNLLTDREREILLLIVGGATNREVGKALIIELSTVENHLVKIFRKLGVRNRTEAAILALRNGLVEDDEEEDEDQGFPS